MTDAATRAADLLIEQRGHIDNLDAILIGVERASTQRALEDHARYCLVVLTLEALGHTQVQR